MSNVLLFADGRKSFYLATVEIDGILDLKVNVRIAKSAIPVETGAEITDHTVREPRRIQLHGWITLIQKGNNGEIGTFDLKKPTRVYQDLEALAMRRQLLSVATIDAVYSNMLITELGSSRGSEAKQGIAVDITLEEMVILQYGRNIYDIRPFFDTQDPSLVVSPGDIRNVAPTRNLGSQPIQSEPEVLEDNVIPTVPTPIPDSSQVPPGTGANLTSPGFQPIPDNNSPTGGPTGVSRPQSARRFKLPLFGAFA